MTMEWVYTALMLGVIGFQVALILGAPWGRLTQGGQAHGALPARGRIIAAVSIFILAGLALAILSASGHWPLWPRWTGWLAVGVNAAVTVLNWITPSRAERRLWGPITTLIFALGLGVMLG